MLPKYHTTKCTWSAFKLSTFEDANKLLKILKNHQKQTLLSHLIIKHGTIFNERIK